MKNLQKWGGVAALYLAAAYLVGIVLFLFVLDYPSIVDPAQKMALIVDRQMVIYATNLIMYVVFGGFLIVLVLALYDRLKGGERAIMQIATAVGIIWAGALIASGMVSNAGMASMVALHGKDPVQATLGWEVIESVANGLGGANGEILGGLLTLLVSWAALQSGGLPKGLDYLGVLVGAMGIISIVPVLNDLTGLWGITQMVWFVWLGIILLRESPVSVAKNIGATGGAVQHAMEG
jgi:hypothetical protein